MVFSVVYAGKFFGASTSYGTVAGMVLEKIAPMFVASSEYFLKHPVAVDWQMFFLGGVFAGALVSSVFSGSYRVQFSPDMFKKRFPKNTALIRAVYAFVGGFVALFGARMAGGCPSGLGLSGVMQGAMSGFIALVCFFVAGMVVARAIYAGEKEG
jgi:uncharacterized membrane protein YedE/YeeE